MTKKDFSKNIVSKRIELIQSVLLQKSSEYAPNMDDAFHNFEVAKGLSFHSCREKAAWEMMVKHLVSIKDLLDMCEVRSFTNNVTQELIEEKFGDAINYLILLEGMVTEKLTLSELEKTLKQSRLAAQCLSMEEQKSTEPVVSIKYNIKEEK